MLSPEVSNAVRTTAKVRRSHIFVWSGLSLIAIAFALLLDGPVAQLTDIHSSSFLQAFARQMTLLGQGWVVAVTGIILTLVLFLFGRVKAARIIFLIAAVGLITGGAATLLRSVIGRTRPNAHAAQGFYGLRHDSHWTIGKYEFSSFPSGHTATVVGLAAAAWMLHRRLGIAATGYAALVSWSRIAQGSHHFSDVVAAAILGIWGAYLILTRAGPWVTEVQRSMGAGLPNRDGIEPTGAGLS